MRRALVAGLAALTLLFTPRILSAVCPPEVAPPAIAFTDLKGTPHTLDEFRGQVVLLEFWASWCAPCRKGFPFLDGLEARHAAEGLKIVAVTLETDDDAVAAFLEDHPARFMVGRDPTGRSGEVLEVAVMPTTILFDREGGIVARYEGGTETVHGQVSQGVEALLRRQPVQAQAATASKGRRGPKGNLRAWERGILADPIMNLDGATVDRILREHIHASKEAAAGDGGVSGGGCGCN